jgi:PAS domain S-box-containing protein
MQSKDVPSVARSEKDVCSAKKSADAGRGEKKAKRRKRALSESNGMYRVLVRTSPDAVTVSDLNGIITEVSEQTVALHKFESAEQLLGRSAFDLIAPEDRQKAKANLLKTLEEGSVRNLEYTLLRKDGTRVIVELNASLIRNSSGEPTAFIATARDITERKRTEKQLRRYQEQLERLVEERSAELKKTNKQLEQEVLERRRVEAGIRRKLELEMVVANISSRFVGDFDADTAVNFALSEIGKTTGASCCCLFLLRQDGVTIENTHSWCVEAVAPQIEKLKKFAGDMFAQWREKLSRGQGIYVRDTSKMPEEIRDGKKILDRIGVKSLLALPVFLCEKLGGFLGLCHISEPCRWSEDDLSLLRVPSDTIGRALERRLVMEALRESKERFRSLAESTSDWVWQVDENAVYTYASPKVKEILGYEPEEVIGKRPFDLMPRNEAKRLAAEFESIAKVRKAFNRLENVNLRKDGRLVVLETSGVPVFDGGGNFRGYRGIDRDITERKRVEEALWESEERYRALVENTVLGIAVVDTNYKIIMVNATIAKLFGEPASSFVSKYCFREFEKRKLVCSHCPGARAMVSGKTEEVETYGVRDDGSRFYVRNRATPFFGRDGVMKGFIEVVEDIGERKKTEEKLKESEERFRAIFDNAADGLLLADPEDRRFYGANRMICQMLGHSPEELVKLRVNDIHPQESLPYVIDQFEKQDRGELPLARDVPVKRKDRTVFYADVSTSPVTFAGKRYLLGIFRDVTERREAEENLRANQARLRTLASELSLAEERERRQIAADLHDHISQSLALAKMKAGALEKEFSSKRLITRLDEIRKLLDESIERTRALTFELSPPVLYQLGFEAALEWLTEQFQKEHRIPCKFKDDGQPKALDEEVRVILFKATRELLLNIAKHAKAKKARVSICRDGEEILITVEDDGIGFNASVQDAPATPAGGFGLFSIHERLSYLGGQLQIDSGPADGTRATLRVALKRQKKA